MELGSAMSSKDLALSLLRGIGTAAVIASPGQPSTGPAVGCNASLVQYSAACVMIALQAKSVTC